MLCILLYALQRKFIYFPQGVAHDAPLSRAKGIRLSLDHIELTGWLVNPGHSQALIYYGGNGENIEYNIDFFRQNLPQTSVYLIPYRGYGENPGYPTEFHLYQDALDVFDHVAVKYEAVVLMGRSLGSAVALHVAAKRDITKLILVTPFDSVENIAKDIYWMFPISWLLKDKFSATVNLQNVSAPVLALVAGQDRVIPTPRSAGLLRVAPEHNLKTIVIAEAGHNDISFFNEYAVAISRFINGK